MAQHGKRHIRWWPAAVIIVIAVIRLSLVWLLEAPSKQARIVPTIKVSVLASILLLIWLLLFSRLPGKRRGALFGIIVMIGLVFHMTVRITGVTGDARPILAWRWQETSFADPDDVIPVAADTHGSDYPQFYGPSRNATLQGPNLASDWGDRPPVELWRREIGEGWSSFAVVGRGAVTQEQRNQKEMVVRYDLATGHQVWAHADETALNTTVGGRGPRATPTIDDGHVFALGATGILNCIDFESGHLIWSRNVIEDHHARLADYGMPSSPLLAEGLVVVQLAQNERSLVAYRRLDGTRAWRAGSDLGSYGTPVLATLAGTTQIVIINKRSVAGHRPSDGQELWHLSWPVSGDKISPALSMGRDQLLVSAGYGAGSLMIRIRADRDAFTAEELWHSRRLKSKFAPLVEYEGVVYGLDDGVLTALDPETGRRMWRGPRYGHGQFILVGDKLLIQSERGPVALVQPTPQGPHELALLPALTDKTWNPPALAGAFLLVRNNREAVCYQLPVE